MLEISCQNLTMDYSGKKALENINLVLKPGSLIGLVGPNGAGKSTLIKLLATLKKPTSGKILLDGENIVKKPNKMRKVIGYLPQNVPVYPELSAMEFLLYMAAAKGISQSAAKEQISGLLHQFHLADVSKCSLATFSGGMRQRIGLSAALLGDPQIIIVDEPSTGLDPEERTTLRNLLSELSNDRIVLLSTHIVSDIEAVAGQIILLKNGCLAYNGSPEKLIDSVNGKVWEYTLPRNVQPAENAIISSLVQTSEGLHVREIADQISDKAEPVSATLEDACLAAMRAGV